jgi:hypothetical protein
MDQKTGSPEPFEDEIETSRFDESIPYTDPRWNCDIQWIISGLRKWRYGPGGALTTNVPIPNVTAELDSDSELFYGYKHIVGESIRKLGAEVIAKLLDKECTQVEYYENPAR